MSNLTRWMPAALALCGLTAFGCSSGATGTATASNASSNDLNDSALALRSNDNHATFQAVGRCKRGRGHEDADDGGVDESGARPTRGPKQAGGAPGIANGLDQLLAAADLTALEKCQTLAKDCVANTDRAMCEQQVADCVRPVIEAAFKALCDQRTADCAQNMDDPSCKHAVGTCTDMGAITAPAPTRHPGGGPGVRRAPPGGFGERPHR